MVMMLSICAWSLKFWVPNIDIFNFLETQINHKKTQSSEFKMAVYKKKKKCLDLQLILL